MDKSITKLEQSDPSKTNWQRVIVARASTFNPISQVYCSWLAHEGSDKVLVPSDPDNFSIPEIEIETLEEFKQHIEEVNIILLDLPGWNGELPCKSKDIFNDLYILPYSKDLFKLIEGCLFYRRNLMKKLMSLNFKSDELNSITQQSNKLMEVLS